MIRKLRTLGVVLYAYMTEYRAELLLWALAQSLPFILMGVWMTAATHAPLSRSPVQFARYFLAVFLVRQLSVVWVVWEFETDIVKGHLAPRLLLPLDPVWRYFMAHIAERFARAPFGIALVGLFFALYPSAWFLPPATALLAFGAAALSAFLLRFAIQYTFAMLAFWTERASAVQGLWSLIYLFMSGVVAPLDLFPEAVREILLLTPFPYLVYWPAHLLIDGPAGLVTEARPALVVLAYFLLFIVVNRLLWRAGLRRFSAMGA